MQWQWVYSIEFAVCFRQSCVTDDPGLVVDRRYLPLMIFRSFAAAILSKPRSTRYCLSADFKFPALARASPSLTYSRGKSALGSSVSASHFGTTLIACARTSAACANLPRSKYSYPRFAAAGTCMGLMRRASVYAAIAFLAHSA